MVTKTTTVTAISMIVILGIAGAVFITWLGSPASVTPTSDREVLSESSYEELRVVDAQHFITKIPANITIRSHNKEPQGIRLEQLLAVGSRNQPGEQAALIVGTLPPEGIKEISDVQFRLRNQEVYRPVTYSYLPDNAIAFEKSDGSELSAFWKNGNKFASIVVSGVSTQRSSLEETQKSAITSWVWK